MGESKPTSHVIRWGASSPKPFDGGMKEMKAALQHVDHEKVANAGISYTKAAVKLREAAELLHDKQDALRDAWEGDDADAAIKQMKKLQFTAENLYQVAEKVGKALTDAAPKLEAAVNNKPDDGFLASFKRELSSFTDSEAKYAAGATIASPGGGLLAVGGMNALQALGLMDNESDRVARDHMNKLGSELAKADHTIPNSFETDQIYGGNAGNVDEPPPPPPPPPGPKGGGPPGSPGGGLPGSPEGGFPGGPGGGLPNSPGAGDRPNPNLPNGPLGTGPHGGLPTGPGRSDLAGLPTGPGLGGPGGSDPFGKAGLGGLPGGGPGGGGLPGGGGAAAGLPGGPMAGRLGAPGGGPGMGAGSGAGVGTGTGRGAGAGVRGGAGAMAGGAPMGRGGGQGEEEHERSTWLTEDEDVWGGDDGDAAPPVIG